MSSKRLVLFLIAAFFLSITGGCQSMRGNQTAGTVIGGIIGGIGGNQIGRGRGRIVATIAGTLIGAAIGGEIGAYMDEQDRTRANRVLETTRTHHTGAWRNPDTGYKFAVTPTRTYSVSAGPCREYQINAEIGGRTRQIYGTACRQPDGSWKIR